MALKDLFNLAVDHFKSADMEIKGDSTVGHIKTSFRDNFGLTLRVYHGVNFADEKKTLRAISTLPKKKGIEDTVTLKATMKAEEVTDLFKTMYGLKVKVADENDDNLLPEHVSLGGAQRGEYKAKKK